MPLIAVVIINLVLGLIFLASMLRYLLAYLCCHFAGLEGAGVDANGWVSPNSVARAHMRERRLLRTTVIALALVLMSAWANLQALSAWLVTAPSWMNALTGR